MSADAVSQTRARAIVRERADDRCEIAIDRVCAGRMASVHHRSKRSHGGSWQPSNLLAACGDGARGCHGFVEAHPSWAITEGLWLVAGDTSLDVSVHMRWAAQRSWWLLDDEGMLEWDGTLFEDIVLAEVPGHPQFTPKPHR